MGMIKTAIGDMYEVDEAAKLVGVKVKTMYHYNTTGIGPKRYKVGRKVCYKESDLRAWMERERVR
jgi:predicted DNA-binding transcriptional regulator AlpA